MPSRDADGKRIPGNKQRQRQKEREAPDRKPAKPRAPAPKTAPTDQVDEPFENPFDQLVAPPIDDTALLIRWASKVHGLALHHIAKNPGIYPNQREWLRALLGGTTQLGVIRDKAAEQEKIDRALRDEEKKGKKQGLDDVRGKKAAAITRPAG